MSKKGSRRRCGRNYLRLLEHNKREERQLRKVSRRQATDSGCVTPVSSVTGLVTTIPLYTTSKSTTIAVKKMTSTISHERAGFQQPYKVLEPGMTPKHSTPFQKSLVLSDTCGDPTEV